VRKPVDVAYLLLFWLSHRKAYFNWKCYFIFMSEGPGTSCDFSRDFREGTR